jgi:hypothetical protein
MTETTKKGLAHCIGLMSTSRCIWNEIVAMGRRIISIAMMKTLPQLNWNDVM